MSAVFDTLGDSKRRRILELLAGVELPAGAIVSALQAEMTISQPAVSQHLRSLREAGLVTVRPHGTRRLYSVDRAATEAAIGWLQSVTAPADPLAQPLDALATEVARGKSRRTNASTTNTRKRSKPA